MSVHIPLPAPVRCSAEALELLTLAATDRSETLAFLLDAQGIGGVLVAVDDLGRPDCMLDLVEVMSIVGERVGTLVSLVMANVRPGGGLLPGDIDRWLEASDRCTARGLVLMEWYVFGAHGPQCPRDLLGEPERWPVSPGRDVAPG